jgi:hypothetical protein
MTTNTPIVTTNATIHTVVDQEIRRLGLHADLNHIDVSQVTDFSHLFTNSGFQGNMARWDVSNAVNMSRLFENAIFSGDLCLWDVSKVQSFDRCFHCNSGKANIQGWIIPPTANVEWMVDPCGLINEIMIFPRLNIDDPIQYQRTLWRMYKDINGKLLPQSPLLKALHQLPSLRYQHGVVALLKPDFPISNIHPEMTTAHKEKLETMHAFTNNVHATCSAWEALLHRNPSPIPIPSTVNIA